MPEFILDTSGHVPIHGRRSEPNPAEFTAWEHLDAFTQGYIEALFASARLEIEFPDGCDSDPARFSDLAPETLAAILKDCAAYENEVMRAYPPARRVKAGAHFWEHRQMPGGWMGFSPLTPYLGDDGKIYLS